MIGQLLFNSGWTTMGSTFVSPTLLQPLVSHYLARAADVSIYTTTLYYYLRRKRMADFMSWNTQHG